MSLGKKIQISRKVAGITAHQLGAKVGMTGAGIGKVENDQLKGGPSPELVVKIANVLNDDTILTAYLEENPVYKAIIPKIFPDLNNIRREPAIVFTRFASEAREAMDAAMILAEVFSNAEPRRTPNFEALFKATLEQIVDVQRCAEILFTALIAAGIMSVDDQRDVHTRQQAKCEERGHHKCWMEG